MYVRDNQQQSGQAACMHTHVCTVHRHLSSLPKGAGAAADMRDAALAVPSTDSVCSKADVAGCSGKKDRPGRETNNKKKKEKKKKNVPLSIYI